MQLLEAIAETGSISAAARQLDMSYRRAWLLVSEMNAALIEPAVSTAKGGSQGGGASLSSTGLLLIKHYRAMEAASRAAASTEIAALKRLLAP
ncbi:winged helix-turn-helix domain-containing protein [Xanthomonas medicagonis]|uniref:winged helix-turn-helix domain-containing protein n=1 Tax=Xanthomonas medicagonis TaxID=3160841 RepID=UPI00351277BF